MAEDDELLGAEDEGTLEAERDGVDDSSADGPETGRGLTHLLVVTLVVLACMGVPYASAEMTSLTVWAPGDGIPVARMFDPERREDAMAIATGGAVAASSAAAPAASTLDSALASNLGDDLADTPPPAPGREGEGDADGPRIRIDPSELEGLVRELEDPNGRAMRPFYEALLRTAEREAGAITRVAHYGDSSIAGDGITVTLRRRLQQRFGDAGHGFVLIARGTMPYRHQDIRHSASDGWRLNQLVRAGLSSHLYGYGGVEYRAVTGPTARFETTDRGPVGRSVSRFELWYQTHPRGGRVDLQVDDGERVEVNTRGDATTDGWHAVEVPDGPHRLELRALGGGESRLYGMVLERDGPGVVYDSLGMVGARARRMLGMDRAHFARQHAHRQTNLIVLAFGGNDADDRRTPEQFEDDFRQVARMVRRARPEAACLIMAPLDQARRDERGGVRTIENVPIIVEAERRAAAAEGCAFFDTYAAMGGEGSMRAWFREQPRLAFGDYRHATPAGYQVIGNMLYKALLKGFVDFLGRQ